MHLWTLPGGCGDGTFDQIPPVHSLGNRYFIVRTQGNSISEQSTIVATEDRTAITINRYNAAVVLTSTMNILASAGNFLTIANGDGTTPFPWPKLQVIKNWLYLPVQLNLVKWIYQQAFQFLLL
ncbi:MAG: IgGFc-binding protein [Saprospiraceae bacterium]|nr:IgGFc-binding protein [Saprospiraceae bacterium]